MLTVLLPDDHGGLDKVMQQDTLSDARLAITRMDDDWPQ
jgi:hypothetical protein